MRTSIVAVAVFVGSLLLATLGPAQAGSKHCNHPRFNKSYGYYYCPGTRCFYHGYWRRCRA